MSPPGRNDPCPCGSGRKFKHCCLGVQEREDAMRVRLREAEGVLIPGLMAYADAGWGDDFFDEAWEEFFLFEDVPDDVSACREFGTTFDPYYVFSFVPDRAEGEAPPGWPTEPVALHFLRHEGGSSPPLHREFIEQACRSHASFFVVEATTPGRSIDLKDILTGRRFHVLEQSASRTLRPGDLTYTRVVTAAGASIMIGASPWRIPPEWHIDVIDFRDRARPRGLMTREDLLEFDFEIRALYHHIVDVLLHPRPPKLCNTDGDPLEMTSMVYELDLAAAEAFERLRPLATLGGETHVHDERYDEHGTLVGGELSWIKAGNRQHKDWDNTILGRLALDGSRLVVEVNSARRREKIEKEIARRLGSSARLVETRVTDIMEDLRRRAADREASGVDEDQEAGAPEPPEPERTAELEALEAELSRRHWDAWVDTKIPALGNRTPRQAAKTERGRERLEALLTDYARSAERGGSAIQLDVGALRRKLGLA